MGKQSTGGDYPKSTKKQNGADKRPIVENCKTCGKPPHKCYCLECFDSNCDGMAPFIRENKKHDCLHRCKKCGDAFWIREDGDIDNAD